MSISASFTANNLAR